MKNFRHFLNLQLQILGVLTAITLAGCSQNGDKNQMTPVRLTTEYLSDPVGLQIDKPAFGWQFDANERGQRQTAYQVLVAGSLKELEKNRGDIWDSDKTDSDRSFSIQYNGKPLQSRQACYWKVRAWDAKGTVSEWSKPSRFEIALLQESDWHAKWIGLQTAEKISPLLRKEIEVTGKVSSARVYISGLGWSELYINGKKVSDDVLSPALTDYDQEVFYCTYDVTSLLEQGSNAIGIMLGNGWFSAANILYWEKEGGWAARPQAIMQMIVTYDDGTEKQFFTDETWKAARGPIGSNEKNMGEEYDARLEKPLWNTVGYDDSQWSPASVIPAPGGRLICQTIQPIKVQDTFRPIKVTKESKGGWVFEFDHFFSGWVRLNVKGKTGTKINLTYERDRIVTYGGEKDTYILKAHLTVRYMNHVSLSIP